ncbi:cytochrome b/b6 domain-containing protein [Acuticoccus sediminis]|uniref:cytochrome b/b6 domain-containing protein n=1 Tax=Acuticoccus sediminis TaxID=2184697 RepID=UPI001CFDDAE9|nr:cytochrome b/b6 domain-containing protein [Acuticoccus sediminis]
MPTTPTDRPFRPSRYTTGAILLHWSIAILVILQIASGYAMGALVAPGSPTQYTLFQLHKSLGATVLLLTVARITWRLFNPPPAEPESVTRVERLVAGLVHKVFYLLLIVIPLTGWIVITVSPVQIDTILYFQNWLPWPHLPGLAGLSADARTGLEDVAGETHEILAYAMGALVLLHIAGAVKHQLDDGQYIRRMSLLARGAGPRKAYGHATTVLATVLIGAGIIGSAGFARYEPDADKAAVSPGTAETAPARDADVTETFATAAMDASEAEATELAAADAAPAAAETAAAASDDAEPAAAGAVTDLTTAEEPAPSGVAADAAEEAEATQLAAVAGAASPDVSAASVPEWAVRPQESALAFTFGYQSAEIAARFGSFDARIAFDPDNLDASTVSVTVDLDSVAITSGTIAIGQVKGGDGLGVSANPQATFTSETIRRTGEGAYVAEGVLRLKTIERPATLDFTLEIDGDTAVAHGKTTLERLGWDVGRQSDPKGGTISPAVEVTFDVTADRR